MIKFAAQAGAIDEEKVVLESLGAIKRILATIWRLVGSPGKRQRYRGEGSFNAGFFSRPDRGRNS
jgi:hypothetical protein